ncbi:MAG: alpha/beta hydrolase [Proteobacteria bacterium]|nr:alpha/beta hydrolase [Pseudomonadota bacterium]
MNCPALYAPTRPATSQYVSVRGLAMHVLTWGRPEQATPQRPALVMGHGYMDVAASFQFFVDALAAQEGDGRYILAPDWRGYGLSQTPPVDHHFFLDHLGDLDALLDALALETPDLLGHSMGGNIVSLYAGVRPTRLRRLVNLEGFGLPRTDPAKAPDHYAKWLDALKTPQQLRSYASLDDVAARLRKTNPRLRSDRAQWLALQWAERHADGRWHLRADAAHRRVSAMPYRDDEVQAAWRRITVPVLWVEGEDTEFPTWWPGRFDRAEFQRRLADLQHAEQVRLSGAGHMLHHDQPEALAAHVAAFLA